MTKRFYKHKLLLDENVHYRSNFPILNNLFDVKHITEDYHQIGLSDSEVYQYAAKLERIVVTFNIKDFLGLAKMSQDTGVIGISSTLPLEQIDKKLSALLRKSSKRSLLGKLTTLTGETEI